MIKDRRFLERFNREYRCRRSHSYRDCLRIFEALWQEAKDLGILPLKNPLEEIESDLRIARAINPSKNHSSYEICLKNY
jgi:hypothetical protein